MSSTAAARLIADSRLIAIVRADTEPEIVAAMQALDGAGARVAEISLATSAALAALERCAEELSDRLLLGAGTVRTLGDAERALEAGARFLVSPNLDRDVCAVARERAVLHLPGIFSPTELAEVRSPPVPEPIKLFPAGRLGPGYVRDLLQPFPDARLVLDRRNQPAERARVPRRRRGGRRGRLGAGRAGHDSRARPDPRSAARVSVPNQRSHVRRRREATCRLKESSR